MASDGLAASSQGWAAPVSIGSTVPATTLGMAPPSTDFDSSLAAAPPAAAPFVAAPATRPPSNPPLLPRIPPRLPHDTAARIAAFHRRLPHYAATPLRSLPALAADMGVGQILLKDESDRFGLPSFKILGASWAVYKALAKAVGIDKEDATLDELAAAVRSYNEHAARGGVDGRGNGNGNGRRPLQILSTTEGNWGRAVARMARYAGDVACRIYVPSFMPAATQEKLRREGADVRVVAHGSYDDCVAVVRAEAERDPSLLLLLDVGFDGFEQVPQWVVEGYSTMLVEADEQVREATGGRAATHVVVPVGAGSIAQAVTEHYKGGQRTKGAPGAQAENKSATELGATAGKTSHAEALWDGKEELEESRPQQRRTAVLAVEADTAACLRASLAVGRRVTVATADTIMCGLNCGTLSQTAWPVLQAGVDYSVAVSDRQAHVAVQQLWNADGGTIVDDGGPDGGGGGGGDGHGQGHHHSVVVSQAVGASGVAAGPCGAATLAGLRKICSEARDILKLDNDSVVVLFCTEGAREYAVPFV